MYLGNNILDKIKKKNILKIVKNRLIEFDLSVPDNT